MSLEAISVFGAVLRTGTLWHLDWSGELIAFAPSTPESLNEYTGLAEGGKRVHWRRSGTSIDGSAPLFEFDVETHEVRAIERPAPECAAPKGSHYLKTNLDHLERCTCSSHECSIVAPLPEVEVETPDDWYRRAWSSPSGRYAAIRHESAFAGTISDPPPQMHLYDSTTGMFNPLPRGSCEFAVNEQLAVTAITASSELGIVALPSQEVTWLQGASPTSWCTGEVLRQASTVTTYAVREGLRSPGQFGLRTVSEELRTASVAPRTADFGLRTVSEELRTASEELPQRVRSFHSVEIIDVLIWPGFA